MNKLDPSGTCFFEARPDIPLRRRASVEFIGTALLVVAAAGSGMALERVAPELSAAGNAISAFATCGALVGLIMALGPVSGGHFNPLVTSLQWLSGQRGKRCTLVYIIVQLAGALIGALIANSLMPDSTRMVANHATLHFAWSEVFATASLMFIVSSCSLNKVTTAAPAVAGWLAAAIIATPSSCYANPALVLASLASRGEFGLSALTGATYIGAEITGSLIAFSLVWLVYVERRD